MLDKIWNGAKNVIKGEANLLTSALGDEVAKSIERAEASIEAATHRAIKTSIVYILLFIGIIFLLVGLAKFTQDIFALHDGTGYLITGLVVVLLARFAAFFR